MIGAVMVCGNLTAVAYIAEEPFLIDLMLGLMLASEIFISILLRKLQGTGTNFIVIVVLGVVWLASLIICMVAKPENCDKLGLNAIGYGGYALVALVTSLMMLTLR